MMFSSNMSKIFKLQSNFYLALFFVVCLVLNEINISESAPNQLKLKLKNKAKKSLHFEPILDEVNKCILACGKCSDDLNLNDGNEDPELTPSLVCANECMSPKPAHKDATESHVMSLLSNSLFDKNFVKCFLSHALNPDYSYD